MDSPFVQTDTCMVTMQTPLTDPNGKLFEFKNAQGETLAQMAKVYKKGGLFGLFNADKHVHAELKDRTGNLLLTTTCYHGDTRRGCKVEINAPDGALLGVLYDALLGADFELPDGTLVGKARRPPRPENEPKSEPQEVVHTFTDRTEQIAGTCDRRYPGMYKDQTWDMFLGLGVWGVQDYFASGGTSGRPLQKVTVEAPVDPDLHLFLFLFPALQMLRFARYYSE